MIPLAFIRLTSSQWYWALAALVISLAGIVFYYRRTVPPLRGVIKTPMMILRAIAAVALFVALADALWAAVKTDRPLYDLVVLLDHSSSMTETDGGDQTRFNRAADYFEKRIKPAFEKRAAIHQFYFADGLLKGQVPPDSFGTSTALGDALSALADRPGNLVPKAVVILSDGASNRGADPVEAAARLGIPMMATGFGRTVGAQASVVDVTAPEVVLTGKPFDITSALQSGGRDEDVRLRLSTHGRSITQKTVPLTKGGARTPVTLSATVDAPGEHEFRIDVIGADGRVSPTAGRTLFVHALKGKIKVLLFGGALDWEYTYLKRFLERQSQVELVAPDKGKPSVGASLPTVTDWTDADVALFLHPSRRELETVWSPHVAQFTSPGHGVVFLLNERFAAAGPQSSPYPFESLHSMPVNVQGEFPLKPQPTRQNHPLVRLDPTNDWSRTSEQWTGRPPWAHMICMDDLPKGVDVLVKSAAGAGGAECPALWTRSLRGMKTIVLAGGPLWRWVAERAAEGIAPSEYDAFWANAIRWLSLRDETDRLAMRSDQQIYHVGEPVVLAASVFDEVYRFLDRAEVTARVWPDSAVGETLRVLLPPGSGDRFEGRLSHLAPGTYRYDGRAVVDSTAMSLTGGIFRVEPYGLEQQSLGLDETLLRGVAQRSSGRYYNENEPPAYLDSLDWAAPVHERVVEVPLWNQSIVLGIFIATLMIEWFVRRRKQLL